MTISLVEAGLRESGSARPESDSSAGMSPRTSRLKEKVLREAETFAGRAVWLADSFRETKDEPSRGIRVSKAVAHLLASMPVAIHDGEILVGWHPNTQVDATSAPVIAKAEKYLDELHYRSFVSEGHIVPDFPTVLQSGLGGIRRRLSEAEAALDPVAADTPPRREFYIAGQIAVEGLQTLIQRYAQLAANMADRTDDRPWSEELRTISAVCDRIVEEPPGDFREALQLAWFVFLAVALEAGEGHHCYGPGRMDQYLLSFYRAERDAGTLDESLTDDLLDQFFIKCNEFRSRHMSAVVTVVGGRTRDGSDATNELSYRLLEASDRTRTYLPGVDVHWHPDMDPEFMSHAVRLLRNDNGQPAFFNGDLIINGLERLGVPYEHAVDHMPSTCTETSIMGRSSSHVCWHVNIVPSILYALFGGRHPSHGRSDTFGEDLGLRAENIPHNWKDATQDLLGEWPQTYAELKAACETMLRHAARGTMAQFQTDMYLESLHRPFPLLSVFVQGCIERGVNVSQGGALYNFAQPEAVGIPNVVDGLAAVRVLVEEQGRFTLDDFRAAVRADFEGYESLRRSILRDCPKHGNDVDWVNRIFGDVAGAWCSEQEGHRNFLNGPYLPGFLAWVSWIDLGESTPATPDGRLGGAPLANCITNCTGSPSKGFPALVLSTLELDQARGLGGITMNARFQADALLDDKGVAALRGLLEGALDLGAFQIQVDLTSSETLRRAQEQPEEYADLFVRIGGYLVPFTYLPEHAQNEIIARAEFGL